MNGEAEAEDLATLVEPSFDENVLRTLCDTDVSVLLFCVEMLSGVGFITGCSVLRRCSEVDADLSAVGKCCVTQWLGCGCSALHL